MTFKLFWIKVFKFETSYCLLMIVKTRNLINYTGTLQNYDKHVWWWKFSNTVQCLTLACICYPLDKKMLTGWLGYQNLSEVVSSHIFEHLIYPGSSVFRSTKSLYCYPHQSVIIYCKLLKKFFLLLLRNHLANFHKTSCGISFVEGEQKLGVSWFLSYLETRVGVKLLGIVNHLKIFFTPCCLA